MSKTYRGSCHCGAYIYDVELPEVVKKATDCNCAVCYKKAAIWMLPAQVKFVKGNVDTLASYAFGRKMAHHKFCPTCGICLVIIGKMDPEKEIQTGLNLRTIQRGQGLDVWKLDIYTVDGASFPPQFQPAAFTGPEPKAEVEGGKVCTGTCHCGAIRVVVKSKPLDKTYSDAIYECDCSSCIRNGCAWFYPSKDQVELQGRENLGVYTFGTHTWGKTFCKVCGTPVGNEPMPLTDEQIAQLPEGMRNFVLGAVHLRPINLRLIDGVNVKDFNVVRQEGYDRPPIFVEPQP